MNNTNTLPSEVVDDNDSFLLGLGARVRLAARLYGVVEVHAARRRLRAG